jgi:hypothetical protein
MDSSELAVANLYETTSMTAAKQSAINSSPLKLKGVNLGKLLKFCILSKTGITDVYKSDVTGDAGASP